MSVIETNTVNFNDLRPDKLIDYIVDKHHTYIKNALNRFVVHSKTIVKVDAGVHPEVVTIYQLTQELKDILEQHLNFEEHILFPYIKKLISTRQDFTNEMLDSPMSKIKAGHLKIMTLLKKIRKLSSNYTPSVNSSPALKLCYAQLFDLEQDIHKHAFLEENHLFPKIIELEKRKINQP